MKIKVHEELGYIVESVCVLVEEVVKNERNENVK